jgi:hypothetical protein
LGSIFYGIVFSVEDGVDYYSIPIYYVHYIFLHDFEIEYLRMYYVLLAHQYIFDGGRDTRRL